MRITNLHFILSFFALAGLIFFGYHVYKRPPAGAPSVETVEEPAPPEESPFASAEDPLLADARDRAQAGVARAAAAIHSAQAAGRDVKEARRFLAQAQDVFRRAEGAPDYEKAAALAKDSETSAASPPPHAANLERPLTAPPQGTYVVRRGDNLWTIAKSAYGRGSAWVKIWRTNEKKVPDFDVLVAGQELVLPPDPRGR